MAVSNINNSVSYDISESVLISDKGYNAQMFDHVIYGNKVIIAIGGENLLIDKGIKYYCVYLILFQDGKYIPDRKIGIYEININDYDEVNDFNKIILFPKTEEYIKTLKLPTGVDTTKIKWFNKFILDDSFMSYYENDDLLELISDTLNDSTISVIKLRTMLSDNVNDDIFSYYYENYDKFKIIEGEQLDKISEINRKMNLRKKKFDRQRLKGDGTVEQYEYNKLDDNIKNENKLLLKIVDSYSHLTFMKNIKTKDDLKTFIITDKFTADSWSITILERLLNFKLILLDESVFNTGDITDVLKCLDEHNINDIGTPFKPSKYMIVCKMKDDIYRLIQLDYVTKTFNFEQLPEEIKTKVADKCWENGGGLFHSIAEFSNFTKSYKENQKALENPFEPISNDADTVDAVDDDIRHKLNPDFSDRTVFRFHKVANSKPLPGMGNGESIGPETVVEYNKLSGIENWRRKLSDMYISQFELDGHKWNSVEHYYQANKFKQSPKIFDKFIAHDIKADKSAIEEDSAKAQIYGNSITRKRKIGVIYGDDEEAIDDDYTIEKGLLARERGQREKFSNNSDLKQMLISTKQARLDEYKPYNTVARVSTSLAKIRRELATGKRYR